MVTSNPSLKVLINLSDKGKKVKISLGDTTRNHHKEWGKNKKQPNHFFGSSTLNVFTTIIFLSHIYQLHALIYGLKFILELNVFEIKKKLKWLLHKLIAFTLKIHN
jgi:hypothetical protein